MKYREKIGKKLRNNNLRNIIKERRGTKVRKIEKYI
jgi:hypothetical protein